MPSASIRPARRSVVARLRRERPDPAFTISLRTGWDPQGMEPDVIRRERDEFETAGIQHVVSAPWRSDPDSWLRSMELLADLVLARLIVNQPTGTVERAA